MNGMFHGTGVFTWPDGVQFDGDFVHGTMNGRGVYKWPDGSTYDGKIQNGKRHGEGVFVCSMDQSYTGEWENGLRHGKGQFYYDANKSCVYDVSSCVAILCFILCLYLYPVVNRVVGYLGFVMDTVQ